MAEYMVESNHPQQQMQCMEVWGGNRCTDSDFEMPGLRLWLYSESGKCLSKVSIATTFPPS